MILIDYHYSCKVIDFFFVDLFPGHSLEFLLTLLLFLLIFLDYLSNEIICHFIFSFSGTFSGSESRPCLIPFSQRSLSFTAFVHCLKTPISCIFVCFFSCLRWKGKSSLCYSIMASRQKMKTLKNAKILGEYQCVPYNGGPLYEM